MRERVHIKRGSRFRLGWGLKEQINTGYTLVSLPSWQSLHPVERLQLLFPTFTSRSLQASCALLSSKWMWYKNEQRLWVWLSWNNMLVVTCTWGQIGTYQLPFPILYGLEKPLEPAEQAFSALLCSISRETIHWEEQAERSGEDMTLQEFIWSKQCMIKIV